jgi:hypothetical protein
MTQGNAPQRATVVTYAKNSRQCFCQLKFENSERVLISISGPPNAGVKIIKLLFGVIPIQTVWECTAATAGDFDSYVHMLHLMFPEIQHPLDSFRDHLLDCVSIADARESLLKLQRAVASVRQ